LTTETTENESGAPAADDLAAAEPSKNTEAELRSVLRKSIDVLSTSDIVTAALEDTDDEDKRRIEATFRRIEQNLVPIRSHLALIDADDSLCRTLLERIGDRYGGLTHDDRAKVERLWVLSGVASRMVHGSRVRAIEALQANPEPLLPLTPEERLHNKRLIILEAFAGRTKLDGYPWRHLIDVASVCNLRCRTCYHSLNPDFIYYDYSPDRTGSVRTAMPFAEFVNVSGTGEPLLSPATPQIIQGYADLGAYVELTTNGTLGERLEGVAPALSCIHLSMDGAEKSTFETIRFGASFEKVCDGIRGLPEQSIRKVNINCVVTRPNAHEGGKMVKLGLDLGVGSVTFQEFSAYLPWHDEMRLRPQDRRAFFDSIDNFELPEGSSLHVVVHIARAGADAPESGGLDAKESLAAVASVPPLPKPHTLSLNDLAGSLERVSPPALEFIATLVEMMPEVLGAGDYETASNPEELIASIQEKIESGTARAPSCLAPFNLLYVQGDGEIRPCCVLRTQVGSVRKGSFDAAWNDPAFVGFRDAIQGNRDPHPACQGCRDGGRFFGIDAALEVLDAEGLDVRRIPRPEDFEIPASLGDHRLIKIWGTDVSAKD
jgi:MoaA/NifB/PqqE/SkfB family radical SAM enzyme